MSIELAEQLKRDLTDKYVVVEKGVPELRRFLGLTGRVKTVNMNGQVLVQFDHPVDVGWYDIHPGYLKVVDAPAPPAPAAHTAEKPAAAPAAPAKPAAAAPDGKKLSPLELARQQAAKKAGGAATAAAPAAPAGKKLSPLELARQQGAGKKAGEAAPPASKAEAPETVAEAPAKTAEEPAAKPTAPPGKKLSPLEMARLQGAPKKDKK